MFRSLGRALTISFLITGHLLALLVRWSALRFAGRSRATRQALLGRVLARLCERLGATFVKLAQVLATRADLLSDPAREELSRLHDRVGPFPYRLAREALIAELGSPPEVLFEHFDPYPVASASVAQVHHATMPDGREVAVKILRPKIERLVDLDLRVLRGWARVLSWIPPFRALGPRRLVAEFSQAIADQLDLRREARNNRAFTRNFEDDPQIVFPDIVAELSTRRVLCMEFVRGDRILDVADDDPDRREILARRGYEMVLRMVFEHGFVHADLHPGNLRARDEALVLFDLGLTAELSTERRRALIALCLAWVARDVDAVCTQIAAVGFHGEAPRDSERLREEVVALLARYGDIALGEILLGRLLLDALALVRRQWSDFDPAFTMVAIAIAVVEGVARQLAPHLHLLQEAIPLLQRIVAQEAPEGAPTSSREV